MKASWATSTRRPGAQGIWKKRLQAVGKAIGPVTANSFLRELRGIWPKADPLPSEPAVRAARHLGLLSSRMRKPERMLTALQDHWSAAEVEGHTFADFEAALVRLGLHYCRRRRHADCPMAPWCPEGAP